MLGRRLIEDEASESTVEHGAKGAEPSAAVSNGPITTCCLD